MKLVLVVLTVVLFRSNSAVFIRFHLIRIFSHFINSFQHIYSIASWRNCPGNQSIQFSGAINLTAGIDDHIYYSAVLDVGSRVSGPLDISIESNRCDLAMKQCDKHPTVKFTDICRRLKDKNAFYAGAMSGIKPPFECPMKIQKYIAADSSLDLTVLSIMPISGYVWLINIRMSSGEGKHKELVLCTLMEVRIIRSKGRKRN